MNLHKELHFEHEVCEYLAANGWLYQEEDAKHYSRESALYLPDVLAWIEASQPEAWLGLCKTHGGNVGKILAERIRKSMNDRGTLDVLRRGVDILGSKHTLSMAQFKPAHSLNASILARYQTNRLRVVRQIHHSVNNPQDAIDLVLFLNGIPVATAELKSDFTQCVADAVDQYRFDRHPAPKGGKIEPLLSFPGGALVHFAVSQTEVMMTTLLTGSGTRFLPFNKGNHGAAGNPTNPKGFASSYLWEEVWQRDSWLEILGRYLIGKRDNKKRLTTVMETLI